MKLPKLVIILLLLVGAALALPYIDAEGDFYMNYTGMCTESDPTLGFVCSIDSLDLDSLLEIYPSVVVLDSLSYYQIIEMKMEENGV